MIWLKSASDGPEERLKETVVTQPAILVHSLSWLTVLKDSGIAPDFAAGHSLGEYSALAATGFFTTEGAIKAVDTRCKAMQEACTQSRGTMAAIIGLDQAGIMKLVERMKSEGVCVPANFNSPDQVAISGDYATVEKALPVAKELGAKTSHPPAGWGCVPLPFDETGCGKTQGYTRSDEFRYSGISGGRQRNRQG